MAATEEEMEKQQMRNIEQQAASQAMQTQKDRYEHQHKEFVQFITETDLDDGTIDLIRNLTQPDFIFGRIEDAGLHEIIWELRVIKEQIKAIHPPENGISGEERALLFENRKRKLDPLSPQDRVLLDTAFDAIEMRVTRALGGFERKELNKNVNVSKVETERDTGGGSSWKSILPGL